nr:unnamed protein product [Haemonchus contortus]
MQLLERPTRPWWNYAEFRDRHLMIFVTDEATTTRQTTATATSTTSIKVPTTFATTSDFEFPGRSTTLPGTSAYDDQGFIPDKESFSTSKTEAGEPQLMDSFLGQYG